MRRGYEYRRKRSGGFWILLILIGVGVLIYLNNQGITHMDIFNWGNFSLPWSQNSSNTCVQNVNACASIIYLKYSTNVSIVSQTTASDQNGANTFFSEWAGQQPALSAYNITYPVILVATRFDQPKTSTPYVFVCKSDGSLYNLSVAGLC